MKVILLQDVKALGKKDQIVEASDGYARNYLFPKKLAAPADAKAMADSKNKEASRLYKLETEKAEAKALAEKLNAVKIVLNGQGGTEGRLYGSITSKEIAEKLKETTGIVLDKRKIVLDAPIKAFGTYILDVKVYPEVVAKLTVSVTEG